MPEGGEGFISHENKEVCQPVFDAVVVVGTSLTHNKFDAKMRALAAADMLRQHLTEKVFICGGKTDTSEFSEAKMLEQYIIGRFGQKPKTETDNQVIEAEEQVTEEEEQVTEAKEQVIKSGGWTPSWQGMSLRSQPITSGSIELEEKSLETRTNLENVLRKIGPGGVVAVLSNDYHLKRTEMLAKDLGLKAIMVSAESILKSRSSHYEGFLERYDKSIWHKKLLEVLYRMVVICHGDKISEFTSKIRAMRGKKSE